MKIVVFDLDETLGCFAEVGMFWEALEHFLATKATPVPLVPLVPPVPLAQNDTTFFAMLDLFPGFLRPHILTILAYLLERRTEKQCQQLMIYTNNQGPPQWVKLISAYFTYKLGVKVFDQIIAAFKVHGQVVEVGRSRHEKCLDDLIKCTQVPRNTEICFLDDQYHALMEHDNVFYITVKPYYFSLPFNEMALTYYQAQQLAQQTQQQQQPLAQQQPLGPLTNFLAKMHAYTSRFKFDVLPKAAAEQEVDTIVSKKILSYLEEFFQKRPLRSKRTTQRK